MPSAAEIYDLVRDAKITGFAIVSGDRHSFWAGYAASALPPAKFEPVGLELRRRIARQPRGDGRRSSMASRRIIRSARCSSPTGPGGAEARVDVQHAAHVTASARASNMPRAFDLERAHALSNPDLAPHLEFVDMGGHGYATVRLIGRGDADRVRLHPAPDHAQRTPDGGPLRYRVVHTAPLWRPGERPRLRQHVIEGDPGLSI